MHGRLWGARPTRILWARPRTSSGNMETRKPLISTFGKSIIMRKLRVHHYRARQASPVFTRGAIPAPSYRAGVPHIMAYICAFAMVFTIAYVMLTTLH